MKIVEFKDDKVNKSFDQPNNYASFDKNYIFKRNYYLIIGIYIVSIVYMFIQINKIQVIYKEILSINLKLKENDSKIDEDMIGLQYPKILYEQIKTNFKSGKIISSFLDFLSQLQIKLIYLEKEINVTKLISFYTARILYLRKKNVSYDDSKIEEFNDIINWETIHKSTQLKGIASDKYLACKYVKIKLGKDLCPHRIGFYNSVEEVDFAKIINMKNVILKVSNGNKDNIYIDGNGKEDIEKIKNDLHYHFNREYALRLPAFFHLYSKKRIILEKKFLPIQDLYEFKMLIFNHDIKLIYLKNFQENNVLAYSYYDKKFNSLKSPSFDINKFDKNILNEMEYYAIKLSEDFPNFVRVDLYIFQNKIYLSELTFDSHGGVPYFKEIEYFNNEIKSFKRIEY